VGIFKEKIWRAQIYGTSQHHNHQKASAVKAQKGRSTHVIVAASGVKGAITSKKAKVLS
jgi:hypothetical protein